MDKEYSEYMLQTLQGLVEIDSPSGFCDKAALYLKGKLDEMGYHAQLSVKNSVTAKIKGQSSQKTVGLLAHTDTLGAMVTSIDGGGRIRFTEVGGPILATLDGEYCRVYARNGNVYTGTVLSDFPSIHVYKDARTAPRDKDHMHIRLDEEVKTEDDVRKLGIQTGDYIAFDTKFTLTQSGYVKSRFLDDKAGVAIILAALKYMSDKKIKPLFDTVVIFSAHEEVGHGGAPFFNDVSEAVAVDMGCVGANLKCTEQDVSICAADSSGPYNYELVGRLIGFAEGGRLSYAVDVYPFYSSDVSVMLRAGGDLKGVVIGPGVHASHGMERTHTKGMANTFELLISYLTKE